MMLPLFEGMDGAELLLSEIETAQRVSSLQSEIEKRYTAIHRLEIRTQGFLNHYESEYVKTRLRRLKKQVEKLKRELEKCLKKDT